MNHQKRLYKIFLTCFVFCLSLSGKAQIMLSPQAEISLITISPGADLFSMYGHTAIRVNDPAAGMDIVFNYGTYDFNTPNFLTKFVLGKLPYQLSAGYYDHLKSRSIAENRSVIEQVLNLSPAEKQAAVSFLENNYRPENRSYLYDFFFDNCSTRARDLFKQTTPNNITFPTEIKGEQMSFRQMVGIYQAPHPWADFGVDLVMGLPSDRLASPWEYMFLPDYLMQGFAETRINSPAADSLTRAAGLQPFVKQTNQVFKAAGAPAASTFITPLLLCWLLFFAVAIYTYFQVKNYRISHTLDILLFGLVGLLGCILLFLWVGTDHKAFANNLNVFWAWPLHLPIAFLLFKKEKPRFLKIYFLTTTLLLIIIAITWKILPQEFHPAVYPLVLVLALRAWFISKSGSAFKRTANPYK